MRLFVTGLLIGWTSIAGGVYAFLYTGADVPFSSVTRSAARPAVSESIAEAKPPAPHATGTTNGDSLERFLTGEPGQDIVDRDVISKCNNMGGSLRTANVRLRREILIRENQLMCLRCGEQNPATVEKGYPAESCHKCCMESLRDPTLGTVASPGIEEPQELQYPPPGLTPEEFQKRLTAWKAFSERYELDKIRQALLKMSAADRERFIMSVAVEAKSGG